jgi:amino acid transporter
VLWSYTGWHYASFVSGEARNPKRNVPIAMVLGTAAVTLTYVLTNLGYMSVLDLGSIQQSEALAADVMEKVVPGSGNAVAVLIAISVFGCAGLYILATPRIIQQMSSERLFFPAFAKSHPKFGVPLNAILLQSAWAIVLVFFWGKFEALYTYVTTTEWLFLMAAAAGIFIVRSRQKEKHTGFSVPLYPVVPALFCLVVGWFIYKNAVSDNPAAYYGLLVIPIGALVYFIFRKSNAA